MNKSLKADFDKFTLYLALVIAGVVVLAVGLVVLASALGIGVKIIQFILAL
jgi:hypothetical protein